MKSQITRMLIALCLLGVLNSPFSTVAKACCQFNIFGDQTERLKKALRISVKPDKEEYELGEKVVLRVELRNTDETSLELPPKLDFEAPTLRVLVSSDGTSFREYMGPERKLGGYGGKGSTLAPGESLTVTNTIYWNWVRPLYGLSDIAQQAHERENITTPCVFWTSGEYRIKVVFHIPGGKGSTIESPLISITVNPPTGNHRFLWEWIQRNPEGALFLQTGEFPSVHGTDTSMQEAQMLEDLRRVLDAAGDDPQMFWVQKQLDNYEREHKAVEDK